MPQLLVTTVFEGAPVGDLVAGRPVPGVPLDVGGLGREVLSGTTDERGTAAFVLPEEGAWTVSAREQRDGGMLQGLMTVQVAGPFAVLALAVRWRPDDLL